MRRLAGGPCAPLTLAGVAVAVIAWTTLDVGEQGGHEAAAGPRAQGVTLLAGLEAVPSGSLQDWVGTADYVVAATVTGERRLTSPTSETESSSDGGLVGRDVTLQVSDVIWAAPAAKPAAPTTFRMPGFGWLRSAAGAETEVAPRGGSRLEVGQDYVLALTWKRAECDGNEHYPARWSAIGTGGVLPAGGGVIGVGEYEGARHLFAADGEYVGPAVAQAFAGKNPRALATPLHSAIAASDESGEISTFEGGNTVGCTQK
ncbi:UNVERIFIED_CONTAM: hypothetical protein LK11_09980 [Mumia flava]